MEQGKSGWLRIALVTPVRNAVGHIEQTIRSVLDQSYPSLQYVIVDGGSTDGTIEIIRKYESRLFWWVSEPDHGMYDAINKGFAQTSGEFMGWISATDMLHHGSLFAVASVFRDMPHVEWITGVPTWFNESGFVTAVGKAPHWSRTRFLLGANRYIQQESTFWRRSLWERAGGHVDASRRNGSDFELWVRFFRHTKLYPVNTIFGGFRTHPDSLGLKDGVGECHRVHDEVIHAEVNSEHCGPLLKGYWRLNDMLLSIPKVRVAWRRGFLPHLHRLLYQLPGPDWPPVIEYLDGSGWTLRR
jgi:glycosyltransferase involved in cell wall biosynthesis